MTISDSTTLREYLIWLSDLKFQKRMLFCCFSEKENFDLYNILSVFVLLGSIPLFFICIVVLVYWRFFVSTTNPMFILPILLLILWIFPVIKFDSLNEYFYKKSDTYENGFRNALFCEGQPHHGIVFAQPQTPFRKKFISDSVDLLVKSLEEKIPFRIYLVKSEEDFQRVYLNPNIRWLWLIGHGERGGLCYTYNTDEYEIKYSEYQKNPNLLFIAQLHCNSGIGKSLIEINELIVDQDLEHLRMPFQNRCYIKITIKKFLQHEIKHVGSG